MGKWLSIIIPHYNSVDLLEKLIESIPKNPEIEIIVVDDKSDIDVEKIASLEEKISKSGNIFLHNTTAKKGAGACRNIALEKATGEWVMFADSDDFFLDEAFEIIKKATSSKKDLIYFTPTSMYLETGELADRHEQYAKWILNYKKDPSLKNELYIRYKSLVPFCKLIRRSAIKDIRFDEVLVSNDVMFSTKLAASVRDFDVYDDVIYCITKSTGTLTTKKSVENLETRVNVFVDRYNFLKKRLTKEEFEILSLSGKSYLAKALMDGYGITEVVKIWKIYRCAGIKVFSVKEIVSDIKNILAMLRVNNNDKKVGI